MPRLFTIALLALLLTGCGAVRAVKQPFVTATNISPGAVEIVSPGETNTVETAITNAAGEITVTREVTIAPPVYRTNLVTNIVTTVNPKLQGALDTARELNSTLNPTPSAPLVNIGLAALSGILGFIARLKTVRAAREAAERAKSNELLETVIAGVEAAKSPDVKKSINDVAVLWGNRAALHAQVKAQTGGGSGQRAPGQNPA